MKNSFDDTLDDFEDAIETVKTKMRTHLMKATPAERFRIIREDFSQAGIETLCEWALPVEDYEICQTVNAVKANNEEIFKIQFFFGSHSDNYASVVKFKKQDNIYYYHADYVLHGEEEMPMVNLFKTQVGNWFSEWKSNDEKLFQPIGEAIDAYERSK